MDWHRQNSRVCHFSRELDDSGAHFWLFDTNERRYEANPLFRRRGNLDWLVKILIVATAMPIIQNIF